MGTPRRRIPTSPSPSTPPFFSRISWARRTSVRSISEADINCAFCCSVVLRTAFFFTVMRNNASNHSGFIAAGCAHTVSGPALECSGVSLARSSVRLIAKLECYAHYAMRNFRMICSLLAITALFPVVHVFAQQPFLTGRQWLALRDESNGAAPYENLRYLTTLHRVPATAQFDQAANF